MIPETVPALIGWFETSFVCFQGPKRAYFDIQISEHEIFRREYATYRVGTNADVDDAEKRLVLWMRKQFEPFSYQDLTLFWRLPEKIDLTYQAAPQVGDVVATDEQVQDGTVLPIGCMRDTVSGVWRLPVTTKSRLVLRTRLVIPALEWLPLTQPMAAAEGAEMVMI